MFKKLYLFLTLLTAFLWLGSGTMWGETSTVGSNESGSSFTPVWGSKANYYVFNQMIYKSTELSFLSGKQITSLTFYMRSMGSSTVVWTNMQVRLKKVSKTSFSSKTDWVDISDATLVYSGSLDATGSTMVINFSSPFVYDGGDLLIDIRNSAKGSASSSSLKFQVSSATGCVLYDYNSVASPSTYTELYGQRPRLTFTYEAAASSCADPTGVTATVASATSATIAWTEAGSATAWQVRTSTDGGENWGDPVAATTNPFTLTDLTENTTYNVQVRANCGDGDENKSAWVDAESTVTPVSCASVTGVTLSNKLYNAVTVNWTLNATANCDVRYKEADDADWTSAGTNISATTKTISGLVPGGTYSFEVKSSCGNTWVAAGETYAPEWPTPGTPAISNHSDASVTATWTAATDADGYEYVVMNGTDAADWTSPTAINALTTSLTGLAGATNYTVYLRAKYGSARSAEVSANFSTVCVAPTNLVKGEVTYTTAQFSWSQGSADNQYQYVLSNGTEAATWQNGTTLEAGVRTVTVDVESGNNYTFYVRSVYNGSSYSSAISENFNTPCPPKASLPYTCGFEVTDEDPFASNGSYNPCWKRIGSPTAFTNSSYKHTGSKSLNFSGTTEQYAILPEFENVVKGMQITFWYRNYFPGSYASTLTLGTMTDPTDASTFTTIRTLDASSSYANIIEESLAGAGASDHYIAFKYTGESSLSAVYLDDITVEVLPSCLKPKAVSASNETGTTADIAWTAVGSETAWKIQYSTTSDFSSDVHEVNANTNPFTLTGLTPNHTTYYARVKADCGGGDLSDWSNASDPFQTECADITVDADHEWQENFNTKATGSIPACWSAAGNTSAVYVIASISYLPAVTANALYFSGGSGSEAIAILPDITTDVNTLQIAFSHVEESTSSSGKLRFGYYKDAAFTALKTCDYSTNASTWKDEAAFAITGVPSGAKLAFAYKPNSSGWTAAIDNITISLAASCAVPSEVEGEGLSTTTASISWTAGGEETAWKLQYSTDGENWTDANEGNNITDNPYELSGLSAGTTYYARVKADCGGDLSDWSAASAGFKTDCNATNMPFEEAFDATLPDCWKMVTVGDNSWVASSSSYYRHSASYSWQYSAYAGADDYSDLITPAINLSEDALLKFYVSNYAYSGTNVVAEVYIQYGTTTTKIYDIPTISTGYSPEQQVVDLSTYTGQTAKFIFRAHGNGKTNYKYIYIDDVEVAAKPCDAPTALSKVESSSNVILSWIDEAASKWNLRWREVTEPESAWNDIEDLTVKTCTLAVADGLAFDKNYQAQVQAVCTATKSSAWSDLISFGLVCGAAPTNLTVSARTTNSATLNWEGAESAFKLQTSLDGETWEDAIDVNAKTYAFDGTLSADQTYYVRVQNACGGDFVSTSFKTWCGLADAAELPLNITSFTALPECWEATFKGEWSGISGNKICFYGTEEQWVVLPAYNIDLNKLSVTFTYTPNSATATFGYLDAPNGEFHAFASQPTTGVELDLAAEAAAPKYIAIRYNGGSSDYNSVTISSISIRKTPGCLKPGTPSATPGVGSAEISWTAGSETAWNLQYKLASVASWDGAAQVAVTENPYELSGLEQGVTYKVRVQAACAGEDPSDWSDEAEFTTDCDVIAALPFIETFDAALSNCWNVTDEETTWYAHSVYGGELRLPGGKAASGHLVKLPNITADLTNAVMTLEYKATTGSGTAIPQVGYIDDLDAFQELATLDKSNTTTEARVALATANGKRLALRYDDGTSEGNFDIAEIRILEQVTLADNADNSSALSALNGKAVDVTIGRTITCTGYFNTICLPFSLPTLDGTPLEGAELWAFKYAKVENEELLFRIVEASSIEAGKPYFIQFAAGDPIENPLFKNVTISATAGQHIGDASVAQLCGILQPETFVPGDKTKLFLYNENALYWWTGDHESQLKSFRAYFYVNTTSGANYSPIRHGMIARIIKEEQTATGVDNVQGDNVQCIKMIENDQIVIIKNGVKYNVQGQVISK